AGLAMWVVNFAVARLCFGPFFGGYRVRSLIRSEFIDFAPEVLGMMLAGAATVALVEPVGALGVLPLAAVILLPQLALERLAAARSVSSLDPASATRLYAGALADAMAISRRQRRELDAAARALATDDGDGAQPPLHTGLGVPHSGLGVSHASYLALHASERWDGRGWPAGLPADATPLESRVLAVAQAWSALTARGGPELAHSTAMLGLAARAGTEFDPAVVEAAARIVAEEEAFVREPAFQPRFHHLPVPRTVRRGALAALGPLV
ncbi:MAG: hypothetical protein GEU88_20510, partial [Solirubrobacterales bacterium]|nr:hypothetical protein [Solirubrobacterales bacterium]